MAESDWPLADPPTGGSLSVGSAIQDSAFSDDGSYYAVADFNNQEAVVWETGGWTEVTTLTDPSERVFAVGFSPDGQYIAIGGDDSDVYIYNTSDWSLDSTLTDVTDPIGALTFSPDGTTLVVGNSYMSSGGESLWYFDFPSGSLAESVVIDDAIVDLEYTPGGDFLLACLYDLTVIDTSTRTVSQSITVNGANGVGLSDIGSYVACASNSGSIFLFEYGSGGLTQLQEITGVSTELNDADVSPDGSFVAATSGDHRTYIYTTSDYSLHAEIFENTSFTNDLTECVFSPAGSYLASAGSANGGIAYIYDATQVTVPSDIGLAGTVLLQGSAQPNSDVVAVNQRTGDRYTTVSQSDGSYSIKVGVEGDTVASDSFIVYAVYDGEGGSFPADPQAFVTPDVL